MFSHLMNSDLDTPPTSALINQQAPYQRQNSISAMLINRRFSLERQMDELEDNKMDLETTVANGKGLMAKAQHPPEHPKQIKTRDSPPAPGYMRFDAAKNFNGQHQ